MSQFRPRILIVGLGSIGRHHLRNLLAIGYNDVAVCRRSAVTAKAAHQEFGVTAFDSMAAAEAWRPNIVLVTNPTSEHIATALWAVKNQCHVFIEKPLSHTFDGVEVLLNLAKQKQLCVAVGCNLRFHPALQTIKRAIDEGQIGRLLSIRAEVGQYLPDWHPRHDYRQEYSARSDLGGGALLTLIHELDYILWIAGDVVTTVGLCTRVSDLEIDVNDVAEIICRHVNGAVSSVHMDFLDRAYNRRSRWIGESGTIEWSWANPVRLLGSNKSEQILWDEPAFDLNETYQAEWRDFLSCVSSKASPKSTGLDAKRVLEIALAVQRDSRPYT